MKTFNTYFETKEELLEFTVENKIEDSSSVLVQVFSSQNDEKYIKTLVDIIDDILPLSTLIGSTTDGEISEGKVSINKTVISFTIFEKTSLNLYISNIFNDSFTAGKNLASAIIKKNTNTIRKCC